MLGPAAISLILGELAPVFLPVAALIDGLAVELTTLCGHDPPPMPTWTADDALILALGSESPSYQSTLTKIDDLIQNWAWDKSCQCTGTGTGPVLVAPTAPPGVTTVTPTSNQPCFAGQFSGLAPVNPTSSLNLDLDISGAVLSRDGRTHANTGNSTSGLMYGIPNGTTQLTWTGHWPAMSDGSGSGNYITGALRTYNASATRVQQVFIAPTGSTNNPDGSGSVTISTSEVFWDFIERTNPSSPATVVTPPTLNTQIWCGGAAPGGQEACCPPDPALRLGIQTIINLLQNQAGPPAKAYTKGTVHGGLTGSGSLTVSGLFGVQIALTQGVPTAIQFPGVPPYERSVGWCSILTGDGMIDEVRITRQNQVWASAVAPYATTVGYQLNSGFAMTLTELLPA